MSCQATPGLTPVGAQHGRGRFIRPKRASSLNIIRKRRPRFTAILRAFLTAFVTVFFKFNLRLDIPIRMKGAWHQLTPAVAVQKIIEGAVACWANGLLPYPLSAGRPLHLTSRPTASYRPMTAGYPRRSSAGHSRTAWSRTPITPREFSNAVWELASAKP
jgi:hypothetical protein